MRRSRPVCRAARPVAALVGVLAALLVPAISIGLAAPAGAIDPSKGSPGYCPTAVGVTVVVDFQQLGGDPIVRCYPSGSPGTGLDALLGAGFQIETVGGRGDFVCRIENRPSAEETLRVGSADHREGCTRTPPAGAHWTYFYAANDCAWKASTWGVANREFLQGGFEGWSFSLGASSGTKPKPRVASVRPGTYGTGCNGTTTPPPQTNDPGEQAPPATATTTTRAPAQPSPSATTSPPPSRPSSPTSTSGAAPTPPAGPRVEPSSGTSIGASDTTAPEVSPDPTGTERSTADDPAENVEFTGGEEAADVNVVLRDQTDASPVAPWAAGGAITALAAGGTLVARRRARARDS